MAAISIIKQTAAAFSLANAILALDSLGYETDTGGIKWGDGVTAWNALPYRSVNQTPINSLTTPTSSVYPVLVTPVIQQVGGAESTILRITYNNGTVREVVESIGNSTTITLTPAQVLTLSTVPVTIVPAPGAGKYISVESVTASVAFVSAAYATNTGLRVSYTNNAGVAVTADSVALLNSVASKAVRMGGLAAETAQTINAPVVASVNVGNPTAGNSPVTITVNYSIKSV